MGCKNGVYVWFIKIDEDQSKGFTSCSTATVIYELQAHTLSLVGVKHTQ